MPQVGGLLVGAVTVVRLSCVSKTQLYRHYAALRSLALKFKKTRPLQLFKYIKRQVSAK